MGTETTALSENLRLCNFELGNNNKTVFEATADLISYDFCLRRNLHEKIVLCFAADTTHIRLGSDFKEKALKSGFISFVFG